jgi:hypothetical protein
MRAARLVAALVLLGVAALLALLAADVLGWRDAVARGDRQFAAAPASASWQASPLLPGDPARSLLGLALPLRFRAALERFVAVEAAGTGYDNGLSEARSRGELEAELGRLARAGDRTLASAADNLLGILAYADATPTGPVGAAPIDESVADFQAAVRLDPANAEAKFNLELLLHQLIAHGVRPGASPGAGGPARGHRGSGGGLPGRGY